MATIKHVYLIAGHSNDPNSDRGCVSKHTNGNLYIEGKESAFFVEKFIEAFGHLVVTDSFMNRLSQTIRWARNIVTESDVLIEVHFNCGTSKSTGTECLIPDDATQVEIDTARMLCEATSKTLNIVNRGVKTTKDSARKKLGLFSIPTNTVIWEICFLTNPSDMKSYTESKFVLMNDLRSVILKLMNISTNP